MYLGTVSNLKSWQDKTSHWLSNPVLRSGEGKHQVSNELCHVIGKSPKISCGAIDQPEFEVKGSKFMFDDNVSNESRLSQMLLISLTGLVVRSHIYDHSNYKPPCELAISRDICISRRGAPF